MREISFGQPVRQRPMRIGTGKKALALLNELMGRGVGESAPAQYDSHRCGDIALELGLGDAGRLKILPVEVGDAVLPQGLQRQGASTEGRWNAQSCNRGEDIG